MSNTSYRSAVRMSVLAVAAAAIPLAAGSTEAAVLMLDFGPTTPQTPHALNSPYHAATPGFTGSTWNVLQTSDVTSGLLFSDGMAATGLALNLGSTINTTLIDLDANPDKSSALGSATSTGIYNGSTPGRDAIWKDGKGSSTGAQITGLAAGVYEIYVTARNTNAGSNVTSQTVYAGSSPVGNFDFSSYDSTTLTYESQTSYVTAWSESGNYARFTVTLGAGDALNIAVSGTEGGSIERGFLNSIQVAPIPEPASLGLLGMGGPLLLRRRRA